jgi:hypothetical protein
MTANREATELEADIPRQTAAGARNVERRDWTFGTSMRGRKWIERWRSAK